MSDNLTFVIGTQGPRQEIVALVDHAFTESDGAEEGALVADLTRNLLEAADDDRVVLTATQDGRLIGGAIFSRLRFGGDARGAFLLGPLAVAPRAQGKGLGGALVTRGLDELRRREVYAAFTYGDLNYYGRFGFGPADPSLGPAPFPLTHPEGWLGQWLSDIASPMRFTSMPRCVDALHHPRYW